jgi:UDP:flavonoid glycosyltransferase YjiC (YdhE family)
VWPYDAQVQVILTTQPALGHFHPMVPVARALADAGHGIAFVTSEAFCPTVRRAGFTAIGAGIDWLVSRAEEAFPEVGDPLAWQQAAPAWSAVFEEATRVLIPELVTLIRDFGAELVVHESFEFAGPLAAAAANIPFAALATMPRMLSSDALYPYLYLTAYPPSMEPFPLGRVSTAQVIRPMPFEPAQPPPPWLDRLDERPLVYVTLGSVFNRIPGPLQAILEALADLNVTGVVAVGPNVDLGGFGPQPDHIHLERYVLQSLMLPLAKMAINHAGASSMIHTLVHGVPTLAMPLGADQPYNAFRLAASGAALQLDGLRATADDVRGSVKRLLDEDLFGRNARRLADEIAALPPPAEAVPLLEELARRGPA